MAHRRHHKPRPKPVQEEKSPDLTGEGDWRGLREEEVKTLRRQYGYNEIDEKEESAWHRLFRRFWGPIPWMIETAALLSALAGRWEDFTIIAVMLLVNAVVDFYQESKALNAIAVLKKRLARKALVRRDGLWREVDARELVPGDIIKVKIGDIVPADALLLGGGDFLLVDQSALTGESLPVDRKAGETLYANAVIKQGEMIACVTATGKGTYFGKTVGLVARAQREERSHFQKMVMTVGNFLIAVTLVMIVIIVAVGLHRHENPLELLVFALVLTISAIPVAMPAVLTVTMAAGARVLAAKEAIVTRLAAIEELAGMDVLCSDKTGTLTQNRMSLADPWPARGYETRDLMSYAVLASKEENRDPIEVPIFEYAARHGLREALRGYTLERFEPFDPVRKRTTARYRGPQGCLEVTKGAPQVIMALCDEGRFDKKAAEAAVEAFAAKGFRALGVAYRPCGEARYRFVGLLPLFDPPREDSREAIAEAKQAGVKVKMVTGDNLAVARYIAGLLEIGEDIKDIRELKGEGNEEWLYLAGVIGRAVTGALKPELGPDELEALTEKIVAQVRQALDDRPVPISRVKRHESEIIAAIERADGFAQVFPEDKYYIVAQLQKGGHIVGMTGDGVNDAPALKKADCGIAVSGATDAARAAADIVLTAPGLRVIVEAIKQARITFERMRSYTVYRIAETIRIVIFMTLAIVVFNFYPVTAVMIILLALLNDLPILMIATDHTRVRPKPVRWDMKEMLVLSTWLGLAGVLSSFTLFYIAMAVLKLPEAYVQSLFFVKLIVAGHNTIFNTRIDDWFWRRPFPSAGLFGVSQLSALVGTAVGVYGFGLMTPIGWKAAALVWAYALAWFVFNDAVKMAVIGYYRRRYHEEIV
ncbi:MAG: HAD-IC family P-type ATPase [Epsilonproteobacteria bacterium]|nr:HAD-IC family P-type ATPase [Campylobacterota bacterium]